MIVPQQRGDLPGSNEHLVIVLLAELSQQRDQQVTIEFHGTPFLPSPEAAT